MILARIGLMLSVCGALSACVSTRSSVERSADSLALNCSTAILWRLPPTQVVEATAGESRPVSVTLTQARINLIVLAAKQFCADSGRYPLTLSELVAARPARMLMRCTLDSTFVVDWWHQPFRLSRRIAELVVESDGADGIEGTSDDIRLPDPMDALAERVDVHAYCSGGSGSGRP